MNIKTKLQLEKRHPAVEPLTEKAGDRERIDKLVQSLSHRAFELFNQRGCQNGHDLEDWIAAEGQLFRKAPCELSEKGNEFMVRIEVPGFNERELEVKVDTSHIYVNGHKEHVVASSDEGRMRDERDYRDVFRVLALPEKVVPEKAMATLHEGILTIFVSKFVEEKSKQAVA